LLRRHVFRRARAARHVRARRRGAVTVRSDVVARQPEVEHAHPPIVAADRVVGLEVAVDQPRGVRRGEPLPGGAIDRDDLAQRSRRAAIEDITGRIADYRVRPATTGLREVEPGA
jgi:hypothetical protein